jgi:predicted RNA-binding Zn-ribbon protein involved in translation (DUF1610 family)
MAIVFSCGSCGQRLKAKDEQGGRQSSCPACGEKLTLPSQAARKSQTSAGPPPRMTPKVDADGLPHGSASASTIDAKPPEPHTPRNADSSQTTRKLPIFWVVGAGAMLVLIGFLVGSAWRTPDRKNAAEAYIKGWIANMLSQPQMEGLEALGTDIEEITGDPRRIPWLWRSKTGVMLKIAHAEPGKQPVESTMILHGIFRFGPESNGEFIRLEVTDSGGKFLGRSRGATSQWTPEFQAKVKEGFRVTPKNGFDFAEEMGISFLSVQEILGVAE